MLDLFEFVEAWLRDLAAVAAEAPDVVLNRDRLSDLEDRVAKSELTPYRVARAFALVDRARMLARGNVNPQLVINGLITELRGILSADPTRDVA